MYPFKRNHSSSAQSTAQFLSNRGTFSSSDVVQASSSARPADVATLHLQVFLSALQAGPTHAAVGRTAAYRQLTALDYFSTSMHECLVRKYLRCSILEDPSYSRFVVNLYGKARACTAVSFPAAS
jgi:hypothetical protein